MIQLAVTLAALAGLWLLFRAVRRALRGAARPSAPLDDLEKARAQTRALALRGAIFAVTEARSLPGYRLEELGVVRCEHRSGNAAELTLKIRAAETYPEANVLTRLSGREYQQRYRAGTGPRGKPYYKTRTRTEWTAVACHAAPPGGDGPRAAWDGRRAVVDGSNVAFWERNSDAPGLEPVRAVVDFLRAEGVEPLVVFDASIGHRTIGRHLRKADMRRALGRVRCEIVPAGTVADRRIIALASEMSAVIVTNDLFRDHADSRPIPKRRGFCLGGVVELTEPRA